jgi:predicted dehydrogenase
MPDQTNQKSPATSAGGTPAEKVTVALVGCGNRGVNAHGVLAKQSKSVDLIAVCDVDESRVEAAEAKLEVPGEQDHRRLLDNPDLRALIIATSAKWHVPIALDAIRAGKHVLIEKPLADTSESAFALAREAERAGVVALVGYQARFTQFASALASALEGIQPVHGLVTRQRAPFRTQFFFPDHSGGIMDALTHEIHIALWGMGGVPTGVSASIARGSILNDETIEFANILIEFDGGTRSATVMGSMFGLETPNVVQFVGMRGTVTTHDRKTLHVVRHAGVTEPAPARPAGLQASKVDVGAEGSEADATSIMLTHFANLITGRESRLRGATLLEGAQAVAVTEAAVESAQTGRRVPLKV